MGILKTCDHNQIKTEMTNQNQEPIKPKSGLKGLGCSLHLLYQDREQNLEHGFIKDQ